MARRGTGSRAATAARRTLAAAALIGLLALAVATGGAHARVIRAGSVLPPGQSGFVPATGLADGTGSPHLTDQIGLFTGFGFKNASLRQQGASESPRPGVTVVRDSYGVPAITGQSDDDLWYGAGYAVAQDRLFELEVFRRATSGRLAEVLGKSYLEMDLVDRRDYYTSAELDAMLSRLPAEFQARIRSYRDGVNAYIAKTRSDPSLLPGEFAAVGLTGPAEWTDRDTAAIGVYLARTVPSDDGAELNNVRALNALGGGRFDKILPLRARGQVATVPKSEGLFPSQPARTRHDEKLAYRRSRTFVRSLPLPQAPTTDAGPMPGGASAARVTGPLGHAGGSNMWAVRGGGGIATLFNGPQLGFQIPELFVELELHGPGLNVRGFTAPGVPVIGLGHNEHVAWGLTSGLSDDDDLYAESLVGDEGYRFKGGTQSMDCRNETFDYRPPPSGALDLLKLKAPDTSSGSVTKRICRTVHGPVQDRAGDVAYARRYAQWGRELETLQGLSEVNAATSVQDVDRGLAKVTWNENVVAADDHGSIGYWHPGLLPLKPKDWDERLPYPGTGEAEWHGFLPVKDRPHVINPKQGFLFNWNNVPSEGWTTGDGPARERLAGGFHRSALLRKAVRGAHKAGGGFDATAAVDRITGQTAQQRPLDGTRLKRASSGATGNAKTVLDTLRAWDGNYTKTASDGTVDPGVAAWQAFKKEAVTEKFNGWGKGLEFVVGGQSQNHQFDATNLEAYALGRLSPAGYRKAAGAAFDALSKRFGSADPARWREPRRVYKPTSQGAATFPSPFFFFDRGTVQHVTELGP